MVGHILNQYTAEEAVKSVVDGILKDYKKYQIKNGYIDDEIPDTPQEKTHNPDDTAWGANPHLQQSFDSDEGLPPSPVIKRPVPVIKRPVAPATTVKQPGQINVEIIKNLGKRLSKESIPESGVNWKNYLDRIQGGNSDGFINVILSQNKGDAEATYRELVDIIQDSLKDNNLSINSKTQFRPLDDDDEDDYEDDDADGVEINKETMTDPDVIDLIYKNSDKKPKEIASLIRSELGHDIDDQMAIAIMKKMGLIESKSFSQWMNKRSMVK